MNILYVHYGDQWLRGSERCLLDLIGNLNREHYKPILWCNSKLLKSEAEILDVSTVVDDFVSGYANTNTWQGFKQTYYLIKKAVHLINALDIKLIHVNSAAPCRWMSIAATITKTPIIGHYHCEYIPRERYLSLSHWVDRIVGVSKAVTKPFNEDNCHLSECQVIYNGIDHHFLNSAEPINLKAEFGIQKDDYAILSVGSLIKRKGYDQLIRAIAILVANGTPAKCLIVGDGSERDNLQSQIDELSLTDHIKLIGERADVARFYNSYFDTFISTSKQEVFGLVNAEAAACSLAVIAPDIPGLNEVFESDNNALFYQEDKPESIAAALEHLYQNPDYRRKLAVAGAHHIINNFSVTQYVANFQLLYDELLVLRQSTKPSAMNFLKAMMNRWLLAAVNRRLSRQMKLSKVS